MASDLLHEIFFWRPRFAKFAFIVTYLSSGGKVGDVLKAVVTCDKCMLYIEHEASER